MLQASLGAAHPEPEEEPSAPRRRWMAILAKARPAEVEGAYAALSAPPAYTFLRRPEAGMVMVRGRAGGTGARFNIGEMTVTRCAVQVDGGAIGYAYVAGRDHRHAELAAVFDALLQDEARRPALLSDVVAPLAAAHAARRAAASAKAAATRVEFFTLVRGEAGP
ncbi:MAG: phosphonate C-P lyase system protein PhnG [Alphaproteobacteria bacterium]